MKKIIFTFIAVSLILASCFLQQESTSESETSSVDVQNAEQTDQPEAMQPAPTEPQTQPPAQPPTASLPTTANPEPRVITVESGNLYFKPSVIKVKANEKVTIKFANKGIHTFTVKELGINVDLSGATNSVSFTATKKGSFQIVCAIPGHAEAGMVGKLIVE